MCADVTTGLQATERPLRILLVAYFYPPLNSVGARRPAALARCLTERGHEVTVLTSVASGSPEAVERWPVIRSRDFLATRLNWRRGRSTAEVATGRADELLDTRAKRWGSIVPPDVQALSWVPFATADALRIAHRHRPDVVVTTSPVDSVHAIGVALQGRGIPWIADLRDGWRFEAPRPEWPLAVQRRLDDTLERRALRRADEVVTVTQPVADDLSGRYGIKAQVITNGFDPLDAPQADAIAAAPLRSDRLSFVHTGGLGAERTIAPLLEAIVRLGAQDRIEVVLAGPLTADERDLYGRPEYAEIVRHLGFLDRPEALALQRAADWLLCVTRSREAPGKLFEYLAAGRPVLVLGDGSAAADIVLGEQAGIVVPIGDAVAASAALCRIIAGQIPDPPTSAAESHLWPSLAERYESVIEETIGRHAGRTDG